jgi:hypothetical protein
MPARQPLAEDLTTDQEFFTLLTGSYARLVGAPLVPRGTDADWLYAQAPFAVVAHNTDPDPKFVYANRCAQACFEYSRDEFVGMPSRLSASPAIGGSVSSSRAGAS